jgi:2-haloacid dehalogenase
VTRQSLKHSLAEESLTLEDQQIEDLMKSYDSLSIFPDVAATLQKLRSTPDIHAVVFSNGTHDMVSTSVTKSPDLKGYQDVFQDIVVVEEVKKFKPAPEVYEYVAIRTGKDPKSKDDMSKIWLVSGNPFDIVGARAVGWNAVWVDRAGKGWVDGLVQGEKGRPTEIVKELDSVVPTIMSHNSDELTAAAQEQLHGAREEH